MANKVINKLLSPSIEKVVINNERGLTMTFVKGYIVWKQYVRWHNIISGWLQKRRDYKCLHLNDYIGIKIHIYIYTLKEQG